MATGSLFVLVRYDLGVGWSGLGLHVHFCDDDDHGRVGKNSHRPRKC